VVILVLKQARNPDAAFLVLLKRFHTRLKRRQVTLLLSGVQPDLARALATTGLDAQIGASQIFANRPVDGSSTADALRFAYELLGDKRCLICPRQDEATSGAGQPWDYVI